MKLPEVITANKEQIQFPSRHWAVLGIASFSLQLSWCFFVVVVAWFLVFGFFLLALLFLFIIVGWQCCANPCCIAEWPSHTQIYTFSFSLSSIMSYNSFSTAFPLVSFRTGMGIFLIFLMLTTMLCTIVSTSILKTPQSFGPSSRKKRMSPGSTGREKERQKSCLGAASGTSPGLELGGPEF